MSGRPNWYSDHPPACTCVRCNEERTNSPGRGAASLRRRRQRSSRSGERGRARRLRKRGRSGCGGMLLAIVLLSIVGGTVLAAFFLSNETRRAEITDWLSIQLGPDPTPIPVIVNISDTPTPTVTPPTPVSTTVTLVPISTPTPQPTLSPTVEPTATAIPSPTPMPPEYSIDDVDACSECERSESAVDAVVNPDAMAVQEG